MAKKTKAATDKSTAADDERIVAFVARDVAPDEDSEDGGPAYVKGQRLDLSPDDFAAMEKEGVAVRGVFVKMLSAIAGADNAARGQKLWVPPWRYEAWKEAGLCEPTDDDPTVFEQVADLKERAKVQGDALADALRKLDKAVADLAASSASLVAVSRAAREFAERAEGAIGKAMDGAADKADVKSAIEAAEKSASVMVAAIEAAGVTPDQLAGEDQAALDLNGG